MILSKISPVLFCKIYSCIGYINGLVGGALHCTDMIVGSVSLQYNRTGALGTEKNKYLPLENVHQ